MSGWKQAETGDLFDPITNKYVGVKNLDGTESLVPTYATDPLTGKAAGIYDTDGSVINLFPSLYNFAPENYKNTRAALAKVRAGVSNMNVFCLGDSTTAGANENTPATNPNCISYSYPRRLADQLTASGIAASWQNVIGDHASNQLSLGELTGIATLDSRVTTLPAGWAAFAGSIGTSVGYNHYTNSTTTNPLTFTPTVSTDTLEVYYLDQPGYSAITALGGAAGATASSPASVTPGGTGRIKTATFTCAGTSVWKISGSGAANMILIGWKAYNATTKEVSLLNAGNFSMKSDQPVLTGSYWKALDALTLNNSSLISPLLIYQFGINDWINNYTTAQTLANIATLATNQVSAGGEMLLVVPPPSPTASALTAQQQLQIAAIYQAAKQYGFAVVDLTKRWTSQATSFPGGYYRGAGDVHPSVMGYTDIASAIKQFFMAL